MLFNSFGFIFVFLPVTFAGWAILGRWRPAAAIAWLAAASVVFYAWWDWHSAPILLASVAFNHVAARALDRPAIRRRPALAAWLLGGGVAANLLLLGLFKYAGFVADVAGMDGLPRLVLPIGISFFSFTQIAYLVDVGRGARAERDVVRYLLFVTYFPHLIAGPLLHHGEMLPQLGAQAGGPDRRAIAVGLSVFSLGLFKKCVLADGVSAIADAGFAPAIAASVGAAQAWAATLAYTLQIYFDFSGYCDMAIGVSLLFGIRLPVNFRSPYKACCIIDFWRRWHMTLSRFLRDYLYVPLGGGRCGVVRHQANLLVTMLLGGIWHGAGWNFLIWGGLHGGYLVGNHAWRRWRGRSGVEQDGIARRALGWAATFLCVMLGWVFFRATDATHALRLLAGMAGLHGAGDGVRPGDAVSLAMLLGIVLAMPDAGAWMRREAAYGGGDVTAPRLRAAWCVPALWQPSLGWATLCFLLIAASLLGMSDVSQFLYFQF